ncbi:radical SAM protein [Streptomyces sp. NPDC014744]|uniref:radical SAM protein n=1 Tax=Streptomyces sp. NPDC014744 TaxID=3364903 RepID=UPI00370040B9
MTMFVELPTREPVSGIRSLELEITGKCQLACSHCLSESSPQADQGSMTFEDWRAVICDAAALGIRTIQIIGGEPTVHPRWRDLTEHALSLGRHVEVYSNLYKVREEWWELFTHPAVTLATSYYSDDPAEHDRITGRSGSYVRTRCNIREAVTRGVTVRAGIVDVLPGQRVAEARAELRSMGVSRITVDRARAVGRSLLPGQAPTLEEMCGRCTRGRPSFRTVISRGACCRGTSRWATCWSAGWRICWVGRLGRTLRRGFRCLRGTPARPTTAAIAIPRPPSPVGPSTEMRG